MNISPAAEAPYGNNEAFMAFLGDHEIAHIAIAEAANRIGRQISVLPLADTPYNNQDWMLDHWAIHNSIGQVLGIPSPDLVGYDLRNESQYNDWMDIHSKLHEQINALLGIRS